MKEKGFTLIELLAVIVILAIIALIATPIVLNIINDTKYSSRLRSSEMYYKALELSIVNASLKNIKIESGEYPIMFDGNLCLGKLSNDKCDSDVLKIKVDGEKPTSGEIKIENEKIISVQLVLDNKEIGKFKSSNFGYVEYPAGTPIYFDVSKGNVCTKEEYERSYDDTINDYLNSINGYNGIKFTTDNSNQNSCLKFYVIEDLGGALNLILDHNTTTTVAWATNSDYGKDDPDYDWFDYNKKGPLTLLKQLKQDTKEWKGTIEPSSYTYNKSSRTYKIDYTGYNARMITADEIAKIVGKTDWSEVSPFSESYSFEEKYEDGTTSSKYNWLYERINQCITTCSETTFKANGYWTASAYTRNKTNVWFVSYDGRISNGMASASLNYGLRPVITISKSNV